MRHVSGMFIEETHKIRTWLVKGAESITGDRVFQVQVGLVETIPGIFIKYKNMIITC